MSFRRLTRRITVLPRMAKRLAAWGVPRRSLVFGPLSLGDDLLCTAVLREARRRGRPMVMFTARPELFWHNPDPLAVHPIDDHYLALLRRLGRPAISPYYATFPPDTTPPHVIADMCRLAGIDGEIQLRPWLHLTDPERAAAPRLPHQVAIHSSGLAAAIPYMTKEWGGERFASLARILAPHHSLVQLGSLRDPLLPGVALDLRGRTSLREAAAVLANSEAFVGLEGFLVHLARAVDTPSVVIHGGRVQPSLFGYVANRNLHAHPPCSPCGLRDGCPHDLACMTAISPDAVASALADVTQAAKGKVLDTQTYRLHATPP